MNLADCQPILQKEYQRATWQKLLPQIFPGRPEMFAQPISFPLTTESQRGLATAFRQIGRVMVSDKNGVEKIFGVFEIDVAAKVDLLRNRVALRQLVARCIDEVSAHAVLAFFVQPGSTPYRLTYAARESSLNPDTLSVETLETATRRFTYVLGPGELRKTAAQRLAGLSEKKEKATLADVTDAFSVERLNKEFFTAYKEHYGKFCQHLLDSDAPARIFKIETKGLDEKAQDLALKPVRDFLKKLLGRLVFLHFLQKKSWLGCPAGQKKWQDGDADFLGNLFRDCPEKEKKHFHSRRLVPLFFDTLNNPDRVGELFAVTGTRVPYLNGGLFERDFAGVDKIDFPAELFAQLLEFFGQYNFTIDENDPDDHEIGIDPEMLGHIFENLLEDNKDKGAYYTPKAVVQYMCQQSLIHALAGRFPKDDAAKPAIERLIRLKEPIDAKNKSWLSDHATDLEGHLDDLRICDPAIGSGAFPIGLLQEIYWTKLTLHPGADRAKIKREIIQRSIYGVDLDAGAVEIARLRFWLALLVEEDTPRPLPNLDYQIMQGNSLLESFEGIDLSRISEPRRSVIQLIGTDQTELGFASQQLEIADTPAKENLAELQQKYFLLHDPDSKAQLRKRIDRAVLRAIDELLEQRRELLEAAVENSAKDLKRKQKLKGNYRQPANEAKQLASMRQEISSLAAKKSKLHALLENPRAERPFFLWHLWFRDIIEALPKGRGGFDILIANPPYISAIDYKNAFGEEARDELKSRYETARGAWDIYVLFFELALHIAAENGVACLINPNKYLAAPYALGLRKYLLQNASIIELVDVSRINAFSEVSVYPLITLFQRNSERQSNIEIFSPNVQREQDFDIRNFQGRSTPARYLNLLPESLWSFLLSENYRLLDDVVDRSRPLFECGEVNASSTASEADSYGRFFTDDPKSRWRLINTGTIDRFQSLWGVETLTHQGKRLQFPCLPEHTKISESRRSLYSNPKIIFAKMAAVCEAFPDLAGDFASVNTNCFHAPNDGRPLQFFAAVFNSPVFTFFYDLYFGALRMAGGYFQWGSPQLRLTPIPESTSEQVNQLCVLVDWLLWLRTQPSVLHSAAQHPRDPLIAEYLDRWIGAMVCELYFPEKLHAAGISFFDLAAKYSLQSIDKCRENERMPKIRTYFEEVYDIKHPLRAAFFDFGSLDFVRTIESKE